jgi:hypothetical protein
MPEMDRDLSERHFPEEIRHFDVYALKSPDPPQDSRSESATHHRSSCLNQSARAKFDYLNVKWKYPVAALVRVVNLVI